jgi:ABC-type polysaccharide/polyol phosphate transport system ATPase subunit
MRLGGIKEGGEKTMNMSKISEVLQGPDESPIQFYECLCEAFHLYTSFDPETTENQLMINAAFVGQAQGDIRQKLQKLEGFAGMNTSQLLEVATNVFVN